MAIDRAAPRRTSDGEDMHATNNWRNLFGYGFVIFNLVLFSATSHAGPTYASIIYDLESARVLHEVNADARTQPASLTKIMTLYLVFDALEGAQITLTQKLPVSSHAATMQPTRLGLRRGQTIRVYDAILSLITHSANDAAVVLAEALGKTEARFALLMNHQARQLGMHDTAFRNASGLPDRMQYTTGRDMMRLAVALLQRFPAYYRLFSTTRFVYKGRTYRNHNRLLTRYQGSDGIKTGYVRASGFNLIASATRSGRRLIGVVLGGRSALWRDQHMATLLDDGFAALAARRPVPVLSKIAPHSTAWGQPWRHSDDTAQTPCRNADCELPRYARQVRDANDGGKCQASLNCALLLETDTPDRH